jgi:hypothetical protein
MVDGQAVSRKSWGLCPQTPRIYRFRARVWSGLGERVDLAPDQIPAPGSVPPCGIASLRSPILHPGRLEVYFKARSIRQSVFEDLVPSSLQGGD